MEQSWAEFEFGGARLGDRRQVKSVQRLAAALVGAPHKSFSAACGAAGRQAGHRIFEHQNTSVAGLLAGHFARTRERCAGQERILVAHDTCFYMFTQKQIQGLARVNQAAKARALIGHGALAMTAQGTPLGLVDLEFWGEDPHAAPRVSGQKLPVEERESQKWLETLQAVGERLKGLPVLLIADREADITRYLTHPREAGHHLLVRAAQDRVVYTAGDDGAEEREYLFAVAAAAPVLGQLRVQVPRKLDRTQQVLLPSRKAVLEVRVQALTLRAGGRGGVSVRVWVIQARELDPPADSEPIHWVLLTTEPVPDLESACQMVGFYARRWLIERLHFTLKSGLRVERLQFDDATSLGHALALYAVVAWHLLHLTYLAREDPDGPAAEILEPLALEVLSAATQRRVTTIHEAVTAIAELGGWERYRTAPPPGVKSLWIGWTTLQAMIAGYRLALCQLARLEGCREAPNIRSLLQDMNLD
jgi:hypothetical protein